MAQPRGRGRGDPAGHRRDRSGLRDARDGAAPPHRQLAVDDGATGGGPPHAGSGRGQRCASPPRRRDVPRRGGGGRRPPAVLARGPQLLQEDLADDLARILAASAVSAAAALTGLPELLDEAAVVGGLTADRVPTVIPGFGLADLQVLGHRLHGTPARGDDQARRMRAASADLPGPARLMGLVVAGHAALAEGRVADALALLREAWAGLADSGHEFRFRCRTLLATASAQRGDAAGAAPLLTGILTGQHPAYRFLAPDDLLALAWGAAAGGSTTEGLDRAVAAADVARGVGARLPSRCSPGRPRSSSAMRRRRFVASRHSLTSARGPPSPVPMPGRGPTRTARGFSTPPMTGPGSVTSSPPEMPPPRRPTSTVATGNVGQPSPPQPLPRSWPPGPALVPQRSPPRYDRCP